MPLLPASKQPITDLPCLPQFPFAGKGVSDTLRGTLETEAAASPGRGLEALVLPWQAGHTMQTPDQSPQQAPRRSTENAHKWKCQRPLGRRRVPAKAGVGDGEHHAGRGGREKGPQPVHLLCPGHCPGNRRHPCPHCPEDTELARGPVWDPPQTGATQQGSGERRRLGDSRGGSLRPGSRALFPCLASGAQSSWRLGDPTHTCEGHRRTPALCFLWTICSRAAGASAANES